MLKTSAFLKIRTKVKRKLMELWSLSKRFLNSAFVTVYKLWRTTSKVGQIILAHGKGYKEKGIRSQRWQRLTEASKGHAAKYEALTKINVFEKQQLDRQSV